MGAAGRRDGGKVSWGKEWLGRSEGGEEEAEDEEEALDGGK